MTPEESAALQVVEHLLRGHHCPACGREWITARSVGVLFHRCRPAPRARRRFDLDLLDQDDLRDEARRRWAEDQLGGANAIQQGLERGLGDRGYRTMEEE